PASGCGAKGYEAPRRLLPAMTATLTEFTRIETAPLFPHRCSGCGSRSGPFIDTGGESEAGFRVYLCEQVCARAVARGAGFAPENVGDLIAAAESVDALKREIADRDAAIAKQLEDAADASRVIASKDATIEQLRSKSRQQEHYAGVIA